MGVTNYMMKLTIRSIDDSLSVTPRLACLDASDLMHHIPFDGILLTIVRYSAPW